MDIICKDLYFEYNQNTEFKSHALRGVTCTIKEGEFFGIIGHTGSGKSTFIQHLNGLLSVQNGTLKVGDFDLSCYGKQTKKGKKALAKILKEVRKSVGMVFQYPEYQLFAETVFLDVSFGIKNFMPDLSQQEIEQMTKKAICMVGLDYDEVKDKSPFELSGGQKRRVAIAGVIASNPSVLILDEPCAGLDPVGKKELWNLLHNLHKTSVKTIIIVSHDMNDVANHCTSAAVFDDGKIIKIGTPKQLFQDFKLIENCGLEVPVTAKLSKVLLSRGVDIDTDYKVEDFAAKLCAYLKR